MRSSARREKDGQTSLRWSWRGRRVESPPAQDFSSQQDEEQEMKHRIISLFADDGELKGTLDRREFVVQPSGHLFPEIQRAKARTTNEILHPLPPGPIIWCDPTGEIYPPTLSNFGIPLQRLFLLKTHSDRETVWAIAECLRCKGVAAVVAAPPSLSRIKAPVDCNWRPNAAAAREFCFARCGGADRPFMPPPRAGSSGPCRGSERCNDGASN